MNNKTNLLEEYVNFVALKRKQNLYLSRFIVLFMVIISLFLIFVLFKFINE